MATVKKKVTAKKPVVKKAAVKKFQNGGEKDSWGRSKSSKWYGFNPKTKKFEGDSSSKTATSDSTSQYKKQIKSYDALIKKEPNTAMGRSNKNVFLQERSVAYDNVNRQALKGKPGYDKNGFPLKKK